MRPLFNVLTFGRSDKDVRRLVMVMTLLHGRLYRPRRVKSSARP